MLAVQLRSACFQKCDPYIPICEKGLERALVKEGTSEPGHCCDQFECRRPELRCENVHCDDGGELEEECPPDSVSGASYVPEGRCCPIYPGHHQIMERGHISKSWADFKLGS
ncbi:unnamed protein product [Toxocara canis]|uniref:VWFC domain-containing protein n=1 Tax=Toxocara canis TaxID=6265 RepID=A0A3P7FID7_TOXCA|nr:unnamed protein product [Toxocara canis]